MATEDRYGEAFPSWLPTVDETATALIGPIIDYSMALMPFVYPLPGNDSSFHVDESGLTIQRGRRSRLVAYFRVDPRVASSRRVLRVEVKYLDNGSGEWCLEHLSKARPTVEAYPWVVAGRVRLESSGEPRRAVFELARARWTGAGNKADLRIIVTDGRIRELKILGIQISDCEAGEARAFKDAPSIPDGPRRMPGTFSRASPALAFPKNDEPEVSVVVPVFNKLEYTLDCLRAVAEATPPIYELIVVDDGSVDATPRALEEISGIQVVGNRTNLGFAKACNQGARRASGSWIAFLNNDTLPQPGWLEGMLACARSDARIGIVGCKLVFPQSGEVQCAGVSFGRRGLPVEDFRYADPDDPELSRDREVEAVSGACLLVRRSLFLKLGGFDERFLNGYEDIDLCLRARAEQLKIMYCAASTVLHYQSVTEARLDTGNEKANVALFRERWFPQLIGARDDSVRSIVFARDLPLRLGPASPDIFSQTGDRIDGEIVCVAGRHAPGHCIYGPFIETGEPIAARVGFVFKLTNIAVFDKVLASVDIYDCSVDRILDSRSITVRDMIGAGGRYWLDLETGAGRILEFRIYWHARSDLHFFGIELVARDAGV